MTELEKQLLDALEQSQEEQEKQHKESMELYEDLLSKYEENQKENTLLKNSVSNLTVQVERLMGLIQSFKKE